MLLIYFFACSSTQYLSRGQDSYDLLNDEFRGTRTHIELVDGNNVSSNNFHISNDSIRYQEITRILNVVRIAPDTSVMPTGKIKKITFKNTGLGMLEGAGFGLLGGFLIGGLMAKSVAEEEPKDVGDAMFGKPMAVSAATMGGLFLGIGAGTLLGAIIGHKDHYVFLDKTDPVDSVHNHKLISQLSHLDTTFVHVPFSDLVEIDKKYVIILWQENQIHLNIVEYREITTTETEQYSIDIPRYVFEEKFK